MFRQGAQREALPNGTLVLGMDVIRIAGIDSDRQAGVRNTGSRERLGLPCFRPGVIGRRLAAMLKRGQTDDIKREVTLTEKPSPIGDHGRKDFAVLKSAIGVLLALIPKRSGDRERGNWREHSLIAH